MGTLSIIVAQNGDLHSWTGKAMKRRLLVNKVVTELSADEFCSFYHEKYALYGFQDI